MVRSLTYPSESTTAMVERTTVVGVRRVGVSRQRIFAMHGANEVWLYPNGRCRALHKASNGQYYYNWYGMKVYVRLIVRFPKHSR